MSNKISNKLGAIALGLMIGAIPAYAYIRHEVNRSETLWGIAYKYKISPEEIIKANPQAEKGIRAGMILQIPELSDLKDLADNKVQSPAVSSDTEMQIQPVKDIAEEQPAQNQSNDISAEVSQALGKGKTAQTAETSKPVETPKPVETTKPVETPKPVETTTPVETPKAAETPDVEEETDVILPVSVPETIIAINSKVTPEDGVYQAHFGDTFFSIATKTGISVSDLVKCNPLVDPYHIPEGYMVRLNEDAPYLTLSPSENVVDSIIHRQQPQEVITATAAAQKTIAVMLPFDTENETISRQSLLATDFYKGFLLALKHATGKGEFPVKIVAIDTQCEPEMFNDRLYQLLTQKVDVIIPPEDESQLDAVEKFALENNMLVLNALNIKDEGYQKYPNVLQCNISQKLMYDKAIRALMTEFGDYTPVILDLAGGKEEKSSFIDELKQQYAANGREVIDLSFKNKLTEDDLAGLSQRGKYIFIPKSGSADVFNKFSETLVNLVEEDLFGQRYKVFGYPDWITFRGEQEEMLHRMGANIYSRFYMDVNDPATEDFTQEYIKWYGYQMEDVYPAQGLLGYDVGNLIFNTLRKQWPENDFNKFSNGTYSGKQSSFHFIKDETAGGDNSGLINDSLYIIEFLPGSSVYVKTL